MPATRRKGTRSSRPGSTPRSTSPQSDYDIDAILATLKRLGSKSFHADLSKRYGIITQKAFGVPMNKIHKVARDLGRSHELAAELWKTGWYEARLLCAFVDEPNQVTIAQMDRWARDFDNWAICDTLCFHLFDRTPNALGRITAWSRRREEFVKRAAFALLACVALHDKSVSDNKFAKCLPLIDRAANDDRNFVKKGVSWALRSIGRRSAGLYAKSIALADRLAESDSAAARWVGRDALRDLKKPVIRKKFARREK